MLPHEIGQSRSRDFRHRAAGHHRLDDGQGQLVVFLAVDIENEPKRLRPLRDRLQLRIRSQRLFAT